MPYCNQNWDALANFGEKAPIPKLNKIIPVGVGALLRVETQKNGHEETNSRLSQLLCERAQKKKKKNQLFDSY